MGSLHQGTPLYQNGLEVAFFRVAKIQYFHDFKAFETNNQFALFAWGVDRLSVSDVSTKMTWLAACE